MICGGISKESLRRQASEAAARLTQKLEEATAATAMIRLQAESEVRYSPVEHISYHNSYVVMAGYVVVIYIPRARFDSRV